MFKTFETEITIKSKTGKPKVACLEETKYRRYIFSLSKDFYNDWIKDNIRDEYNDLIINAFDELEVDCDEDDIIELQALVYRVGDKMEFWLFNFDEKSFGFFIGTNHFVNAYFREFDCMCMCEDDDEATWETVEEIVELIDSKFKSKEIEDTINLFTEKEIKKRNKKEDTAEEIYEALIKSNKKDKIEYLLDEEKYYYKICQGKGNNFKCDEYFVTFTELIDILKKQGFKYVGEKSFDKLVGPFHCKDYKQKRYETQECYDWCMD
jgi:hypothetical protein